jgi:hypothetical protein
VPVLLKLKGSESLGHPAAAAARGDGWLVAAHQPSSFRRSRASRCSASRSTAHVTARANLDAAADGLAELRLLRRHRPGLLLGNYNSASEELALQRGIDLANLEQVNQLIIRDMDDGVLVVDEDRDRAQPQRAGRPAARARRLSRRQHAARRLLAALDEIWQTWYTHNGSPNATIQLTSRRAACRCGWRRSRRSAAAAA